MSNSGDDKHNLVMEPEDDGIESPDHPALLTKLQRLKKEFQKQKILNSQRAKPGEKNFIMILDHMKSNFNIGKIFRSAEVFGCREVHVVGTKEFNPYPAKGGFRHVPAKFFETFDGSYARLKELGYEIYLMDPTKGEDLYSTPILEKAAFVVGHEFKGVSFDPDKYPGAHYIKIQQIGKTQSLNASIAASIAMYEYVRRF